MGLFELGIKSASAIEDIVIYTQETQQGVGSLVMYSRLEKTDPLQKKRNVHHLPGLLWDWKQLCHQEAALCTCLQC